jgi:REP element-mobilizing transposase RayT
MSYVNILIHAVVRTHKSEPTLPTDERIQFLYKDMWGIIKNKGGHLYRINSMPDHVHLLFTMLATISLSEFMQALKGSSSKTIKSANGFENFRAWGEGYAALSKSMEDKQKIINYIINQQEHHKTESFKDEYKDFIREMELEFDERDWNR